jgi:hypothetical protein
MNDETAADAITRQVMVLRAAMVRALGEDLGTDSEEVELGYAHDPDTGETTQPDAASAKPSGPNKIVKQLKKLNRSVKAVDSSVKAVDRSVAGVTSAVNDVHDDLGTRDFDVGSALFYLHLVVRRLRNVRGDPRYVFLLLQLRAAC